MMFKIFLKIYCLLPLIWHDSIKYRRHSFEKRYFVLQYWCQRLLKRLGFQLEVQGLENVKNSQTALFVSNHQGILDPALIVATCPVPLSFISKKTNGNIPILSRWICNLEVILFERNQRSSAIQMLREATRTLKQHRNLLIFPEGTRSKSQHRGLFKSGAIQPAYLAKSSIIPITVNGTYCIEKKMPLKGMKLTIYFGQPISFQKYHYMSQQSLTEILQKKIDDKLEKG